MTLSEAKDSVSSIDVIEYEVITGSIDGRVRCYDIRKGIMQTDVVASTYQSINQNPGRHQT